MMGPISSDEVSFPSHMPSQGELGGHRTGRRSQVRSKRQERVVGHSCVARPDISEGAFDQDQARATEEAGEEATYRQSRETLRYARPDDEQAEDGQADQVHRRATEAFAQMRRHHRSKGDAEEIE